MHYLLFLGGMLVGGFIGFLIRSAFTRGTIRIDRHNPEKDVYRLEIDRLDNLHDHKRVILKIDSHADFSRQ